jgi:hypothetical protein
MREDGEQKILKARDLRTAVQSISLYDPAFGENFNFFGKINLHWNSLPHPQQKPASRDGGLASWLSRY